MAHLKNSEPIGLHSDNSPGRKINTDVFQNKQTAFLFKTRLVEHSLFSVQIKNMQSA